MSIPTEYSATEQVYYLGLNKRKWERSYLSVKGNERDRKYVAEIQRVHCNHWIFSKSKKPEIVELGPNSHAVIPMDCLDNHRDVVALVPVNHSCNRIRGQFFASPRGQSTDSLKGIFTSCCADVSFDVDIEESCNSNAQLHILPDKIFIITNQRYHFEILKAWPITFCKQVIETQNCAKLIMANETLALKTPQGSEIKSVLTERLCCLGFHHNPFPAVHCDRNSNSTQQTSCDSLLESESISSCANESLFQNRRNLPSPGHESHLSDESVNVNMTLQNVHCISDSCLVTSIGGKCASLDDNHVNAQRLMEFKGDNKPVDGSDDQIKSNRIAQDDYQMIPPPIPVRKSKPGLPTVKPEKTGQIGNCASSSNKAAPLQKLKSQSDPGQGGTIPRSQSFQIVQEHPFNQINKRRQRYKSDTSLMARKTITEYVQPICVDSKANENFGQAEQLFLSSNDDCLRENKKTGPVDSEGKACKTTATETIDDASGNDKIHYVNLPVDSRPSCYLYMNLPDLGSAPKEEARSVKHVFISRNMKVIYENVFQNDLLSVDEREELPPLPPPILQPRKPPPRIPERMNRRISRQRQLVELPKTERTPPPRPPKKQKAEIQVQGAVFASRAVAGGVWYVRVVVMRHDPQDTTFKHVFDREMASNYHLVQTFPFNISSDIVISLKHDCSQFKLTSDDRQEIDYKIIENLIHFWFVIEFHLQHLGTEAEADQFVGQVCMEPKDLPAGEKCPINKKFNLGISEEFEVKKPRSHQEELGMHDVGERQASKCFFSDYKLRKHICERLDDTLYSRHTWRDVAGKLGIFSADDIKTIENKAHRSLNFSPMEYVLSVWTQRDPSCSIDKLVNILKDIQRHDIVMDLGFPLHPTVSEKTFVLEG
ncbi:uncharacterized protein LOC114947369 [Acropora millepora]|uniref:uncharacterized protein LOC114947369 n=1 Tax=Acropora millepora TaxID=45264 RepID=UPI001CF48EE1|nr:uncharacterized protein LOC114947369 [Acropora millepora]